MAISMNARAMKQIHASLIDNTNSLPEGAEYWGSTLGAIQFVLDHKKQVLDFELAEILTWCRARLRRGASENNTQAWMYTVERDAGLALRDYYAHLYIPSR